MERFGQDLLLMEKLAAGGMAEVHRAKQLGYGGFEKTVAVKRILPHFASSEEFKSMFRMEANLSGLLQHPNVVQVFGNGDFEGYLYLTMEFVDGRNLRQLLARTDKTKTKIPIEIACHIICETAKGLDYAHSFIDEKTGQPMEIVHRDMSPQNIMLSYDGGVKIVDFGIAKAAARADVTRAGVLKGKFGYMSPEQASGQKLDRRTDIFAIGIIFFEILTQRRLFTTDDDLRTLQLVRECRVPRPSRYNPAISPTLDKIVMKALAKERSDRYANAGEFYADLLRFMNQTYPKFIPTDFAKFMRTLFAEDIKEDRVKREKMAAEAPARMTSPAGRAPEPPPAANAPAKKGKKGNREEATHFDEEIKTQVSSVGTSGDFRIDAQEDMIPSSLEMSEAKAHIESPLPSPEERTRVTNNQELAAKPEGEVKEITMTENPSMNNFSLSLPNVEKAPADAPAISGAGFMESGNVIPARSELSLVLNEFPEPKGILPPTKPSGALKPLPKRQPSSSSRRVLMYGGTLVLLGGVIYLQQMKAPAKTAVAQVSPAAGNSGAMAERKPAAQFDAPTVTAANDPAGSAAPVSAPAVNAPAAAPLVPAVEAAPVAAAADKYAPATPEADFPKSRESAQAIDTTNNTLQGYITILAAPRATEVSIDGNPLSDAAGNPMQTPLTRYALPTGTHRVKLRNSVFGVEWEEQVEIAPDKILSLNPTLK